MPDPSEALQIALFERLSSDLTVPVYDAVPDNAKYPYVTLDYEVADNNDPLASRRDSRLFYLSIWSNYHGQMEVKRIMAQIDSALHKRPLPLETGRVASVRVNRKSTNREPDGRTYQGSVTLRILTEH